MLERITVFLRNGLITGPLESELANLKAQVEVIRKPKIYEEVAKQIARFIGEELRPGEKLPPERQLVDIFKVSRSSIRDAIRTLELLGIVEPRQGVGTVVRQAQANAVFPISSVLLQKHRSVAELLDVRKMIEPALASRAALNASPEEISDMEEILQRQQEKVCRDELAIEEDAEFHYNIALASGNSIVLKVLDVVMDLLRNTRERSLQMDGRQQKSLAGHRRILAAIRRHDPDAAQLAMRQHIEDVEEIVLNKFCLIGSDWLGK